MQKYAPLVLAVLVVGCDDPDLAPGRPSPIASTLTIEALPAVVFQSGSTARVTARVTDTNGTRVSGTPVEFSTDTGTLDATMVTTNENGTATVTVTAAETATVRASAIGLNRDVTLPGVAPFTVTVTPAVTSATVGTPVAIRVVAVAPTVANAPTPQTLTLTCAGETQTLSGNQAPCTFTSAGQHTVTATGTVNGWTTTGRATIAITARPDAPTPTPIPAPIPVLDATLSCQTSAGSLIIACNVASVRYGGSLIGSETITEVRWDWGDQDTEYGVALPHDYAVAGTYTVQARVTANTSDGLKSTTVSTTVRVPGS